MIKFRIFGFPVAIQAFFFLTAYFIGPKHPFQAPLFWIPAVFLGVLAHELGHAFAARSFGLQPVILLHGFGGQTSWRSPDQSISAIRNILLSAAGPGVGILIGASLMALRIFFPSLQSGAAGELTINLIWVNLGWGLLNLLPVLPLDGGHIAATAATALFGRKGTYLALVISLILTLTLGVWAVLNSEIWMAVLALILSISNIQGLGFGKKQQRRSAPATDAEKAYEMARSLAEKGEQDGALDWLETAIRAGFARAEQLDADPSWAGLRQHPRFVLLRRLLSDRQRA